MKLELFINRTTDGTSGEVALRSSQVEIVCAGTFDGATVYFEDSKYGLGWAEVLDVNAGTRLDITEPTNEIELVASTNVGRSLRAVITSAGASTNITIVVDDGTFGL